MSTPSSPAEPPPTGTADPEHPVVLETIAAVPGETTSRVGFTRPAVALLQELWEQHGPLMFHQSGGCCDGWVCPLNGVWGPAVLISEWFFRTVRRR